MPERPLQKATDGGTGALCAQADAETDVAVSATCRQRAAASGRTTPAVFLLPLTSHPAGLTCQNASRKNNDSPKTPKCTFA